ncbi:hypothetical protein SAMN05444972_10653 [Marininema halotolerans]|uniref:Uncharacterized protein n=1 Tax=Marininema halotolerans TaxID=1155944 RepID=A0A1I6RZL8_9BACL|nr:hypothetical protein SAMN05444972_10653 [Marininema halotolerans]
MNPMVRAGCEDMEWVHKRPMRDSYIVESNKTSPFQGGFI